MPDQQRQLPQDLIDALDGGELTRNQLIRLVTFQAEWLGLTFDQAVEQARNNTLPKHARGTELQFNILALDHDANRTNQR